MIEYYGWVDSKPEITKCGAKEAVKFTLAYKDVSGGIVSDRTLACGFWLDEYSKQRMDYLIPKVSIWCQGHLKGDTLHIKKIKALTEKKGE